VLSTLATRGYDEISDRVIPAETQDHQSERTVASRSPATNPTPIKGGHRGCARPHCAISALICTAATSAGIDPDRVKFKPPARVIRRRVADPAFP
jgi:hypothetical protein